MSGADKPGGPEYAVFCGLDVGKSEHHACALDAAGKRLHDKALPNDEEALAAVFDRRAVNRLRTPPEDYSRSK